MTGRLGIALAALILLALPAAAQDETGWWVLDRDSWRWTSSGDDHAWALSVFGGEGTERNLSDTIENLFAFEGSSDRIVAVAGSREIARFRDQLAIEAELMYGYHYGRETYHEVGGAAYLRWLDFPWNDHVVTTFAVGLGPSWTTIYPELERQDDPDNRSRLLNQFNLELTAALPRWPDTALLVRLQHRSGVFGTLGGVWDASNFLVIGLRQGL